MHCLCYIFLIGSIILTLITGHSSERRISKRDVTQRLADYIDNTQAPPAVGPPGLPGPRGIPGARGLQGREGNTGVFGKAGATGATGSSGPQGATGNTGTIGSAGGPGNKGRTGLVGATGITGATGLGGSKGPIGPPGATRGSVIGKRSVLRSDQKLVRTTRSVDDGTNSSIHYCTITWEIGRYSNYGNSYRSSMQPNASSCVDVCRNSTECTKVDVQCSISNCTCWLHNIEDRVEDLIKIKNVKVYAKEVECSKISPARGPTGPAGPPGITGFTGPTGRNGFPGRTGAQGFQGFPGGTGATGLQGGTGGSGEWGIPGQLGLTGATGGAGATGMPGRTGVTGVMGPPRSSKRKRFVRSVESVPGKSCDMDRTDYCVLTWKKVENSNFRNPFKGVMEKTIQSCLDECIDIPGCIAVNVVQQSEANYYSCWFYNNPQCEQIPANSQGMSTYVMQLACSRSLPAIGPPGPPGPSGLPGPEGLLGKSGVEGFIGSPGLYGMTGILGRTGVTGNTGSRGNRGPTGAHGDTGPAGMTGATGQKGQTGFTGDTGYAGAIGQ